MTLSSPLGLIVGDVRCVTSGSSIYNNSNKSKNTGNLSVPSCSFSDFVASGPRGSFAETRSHVSENGLAFGLCEVLRGCMQKALSPVVFSSQQDLSLRLSPQEEEEERASESTEGKAEGLSEVLDGALLW